MTKSTIQSLEAEIAELRARLERVNPTPIKPKSESVERYLEMALNRTEGDVARASGLFLAWTEQDSQVRESLREIVEEAIERRLSLIADKQQQQTHSTA